MHARLHFGAHHQVAFVLIAAIALSLGVHYFREVSYPLANRRLAWHASMVDGTAPSQMRHRVLVPHLVQWWMNAVRIVNPGQTDRPERPGSQKAILFGYFIADTVFLFAGLAATYLFAQGWLPRVWALLAAVLQAALLPLTFSDVVYHPCSQAEFGFFAVGLLLLARQKYALLAWVVLAASLNRETSLFLVIAIACASAALGPSARVWVVAYAVIWAAVFVGLRMVLGFPPPTFTVEKAIAGNLSPPRLWLAVVLNLVIFGPVWVLIIRGYTYAPAFLRRTAWCIPPYIALLLLIGYWNEVRYWTAVFPILVPLAVTYMHHHCGNEFLAPAESVPLKQRSAQAS